MAYNANRYSTQDSTGNLSGLNSNGNWNLLGAFDDVASSLLFGDPNASTSFWNDITGVTKQQKEFDQQEYLLQQQQDFADERNRMQRLIQAGVNPNTAAAGVAGTSSSPSAPSVSASGDPAAGVNALSGVANAITGGKAALAEAAFKEGTLEPTVENLRNTAFQALTQGGLNQWSAHSIESTLPLITDNLRADYYQKLASIEETWARYENILAEHKNIIAKYDEIVANASLLYSEVQVNEAREAKIKEETRWIKADNDFWDAEGYRRDDAVHQAIIHMKTNGKDPSVIGDVIADYSGKVTAAEESKKAEASWNYRPTNAVEAAINIGQTLGSTLRETILGLGNSASWSDLAAKLNTSVSLEREFNDAYNEAKADLKENYRKAKRYYNYIKNGNTQEAARAYNAYMNAKNEYESFSREKFGNELIKSLSPQ